MSSAVATLLGQQEPSLLHLPAGVVSLAAAQGAIDWAESCGLVLDESQCIALRAGMGVRADRKWAALQVVHCGPRQSTGKTATAVVREGYEMFVVGSRLVVHTAHEQPTSDEAFLFVQELVENNSEMRAEVYRFNLGRGDHAVLFKSGARWLFKTRTGGALRGFSGASLLTADESLYLDRRHVSAATAILARGPRGHNPQFWSLSSAAFPHSSHLHAARRRALEGNGGRMRTDRPGRAKRFAYVEHTAEVLSLDEHGRVLSNRLLIDHSDRRVWALANPAMNREHGVDEEFIEGEQTLQSNDPEGWARERLNVFDPPDELDVAEPVVDERAWAGSGDVRAPVHVGEVQRVVAWDVSPTRRKASICWVGLLADGRWWQEPVDRFDGTDGVARRVASYCKGAGGLVLGVAVLKGSPAYSLLEDVKAELAEAGVSLVVSELASGERVHAASSWSDKVQSGSLRHLAVAGKLSVLDVAVRGAVWRQVGDSQVFDRRNSRADITSLLACATALRALETAELPNVVDLLTQVF